MERIEYPRELLAMFEAAGHHDYELVLEDWSAMYAEFVRCRRAGVSFDPEFIEQMERVNRAARFSAGDGDADLADARLEH